MKQLTRPMLRRLAWLDDQLRHDRYPNSQKMRDVFEVSDRTFYRDVACLKDMDAPIDFNFKYNGYFYTHKNFVLPAVRLTEGELIAAFIAEKVLRQYAGTPYESHLKAAFDKITQLLPEQVSVHLSYFDAALTFDLGPVRSSDDATYQLFAQAATERYRVRMRYYTVSRDEETERDVDVYHLHNYQGDWFLIAYDHLRKGIRDFALSRVRSARLTGERFTLPKDFDAPTYLHQSLGVEKGSAPVTVRIRFDAYQARWIRERQWHHTQRLTEHKDGSLTLTFTVTGLDEVKRWVMQYGAHAEVLSPPTLRAVVAEEARKMVEVYDGMRDER
jgi:predicted DNA-binding transcriptional regulator YafY